MSGPITINEEALAELPAADRKELETLLRKAKHELESNPLASYLPEPKQTPFHTAHTKIKAFIGGNRSGKSTSGVVDDLIQVVDRECLPSHLCPFKRWEPPIRARIVAPKFNENIEQVIFPMIRRWVPKAQLKGGGWDSAFSKSRRVLEFANESTIQFLTFDQDLDAHAGAALHRAHFDEEPEGEKGMALFQETMMRLSDFDGDFVLTMTPLFGLSWAYDEIFKRRLDPSITVVQVDSSENSYVDQAALEREFARMPKEMRDARKHGKFVHFAGKFYPEFGEDHLVDPPSPEHVKEQAIVVGIDPGLNRTGVVWAAFDNDNVALIFDELYPEQAVVEDVAKQIHQINRKWGIDPDYYVIDPSARNRATVNAVRIEDAYLREGIGTVHGQEDRGAGIMEVKRRLQHQGLFVSKVCANLSNEFEHYRRDPNSNDEFAAVKKNDHLVDALRYLCMSRPWAGDSPPIQDVPDHWVPGTAPSADWLERNHHGTSPPLGVMS
jgi:hypothetical protein